MENQELNMEKILEVTNKYFKGNKDVILTDLQMELLRNVAEYDDVTNNLIKMLKLNSEKKQLKRVLDSLEKESSYISYITDSDEEPSFSLCKEDLAQTARDIKPFHM